MQNQNAVLRCLRESGPSFRAEFHAYSLMDAHICALALQERGPFDAAEKIAQVM